MIALKRLMHTAEERACRLAFRFDPEETGEEWGIKLYPHQDDDAHFYAYNTDLDAAARLLLDELRGFSAW